MPCPLRILARLSAHATTTSFLISSHQSPRPLVELNIEILVEFCYAVLLRPFLGFTELSIRAIDVELACPKIASTPSAVSSKQSSLVLTKGFGHRDLEAVPQLLVGRDPSQAEST
jgi:hypothetical protein